ARARSGARDPDAPCGRRLVARAGRRDRARGLTRAVGAGARGARVPRALRAGGGRAVNEQQRAAVEAGGEVFVSAGAGTGKTAVLVERFVRAVCDRGLDVDSILVITYTRRAAGELRTRIRA